MHDKRLYDNLSKLKKRDGLTESLKHKLDIFLVAERISEEWYFDLMDIEPDNVAEQ